MAWLDDLRVALQAYYPPGSPIDVVGYLRGSLDPAVWRGMERQQNRQQMIILGSVPPSAQDWSAAGVGQRDGEQVVKIANLTGFIILYGGFVRRPWGKIFMIDAEGLRQFPNAIAAWRKNYRPPPP